MKYRPDIDGLRAIAVLLVVVYHAFPNRLSGGFVGVDVFFVISGFLIASIVTREIEERRFSVLRFYARRVRRIFPALLLVLGASAIIGWHILLPHQFRAFTGHLISSALFVPNFAFWRETGYFAPASDSVMLLHLWSLGIEEQFYLFFPALAVALLPFGRRRWLWTSIAALMVSLLLAVVWSYYRPSQAFYFPVFRAWELLAGVVLASLPPRLQRAGTAMMANALTVAGVLLIVVCGVFYTSSDVYPGWRAAFPVAGAAMCILAGRDSPLARRVLGSPAFVAIGLISYPLYLWHWPLLVAGNIVGINDPGSRGVLVLLSFCLAALTYHFLELPLRKPNEKKVAVVLVAAMGLLTTSGILARYGAINSFNDTAVLRGISHAATDFINTRTSLPAVTFGSSTFSVVGHGPPGTLMIGDSNMEQYYPRIENLNERGQLQTSVVFATLGGCPPIMNVSSPAEANCSKFVADAFAFAKRPELQRIAISAAWYGYFNGSASHTIAGPDGRVALSSPAGLEAAIGAIASELSALKRTGKQVYLILNIPFGAEFEPMTRVQRTWTGAPFGAPPVDASRQDVVTRSGPIRERLIAMAHQAGIEIIDPMDTLCSQRHCSPVDEKGIPIYKDAGHLRAGYVRERAQFIDRIVGP